MFIQSNYGGRGGAGLVESSAEDEDVDALSDTGGAESGIGGAVSAFGLFVTFGDEDFVRVDDLASATALLTTAIGAP
jgi:hypothetical protein